MKNKLFKVFAIVMLVAVTSAGCGGLPGGPEATLTPIPPVVADIEIVAEGRIVPRDSVQLSFLASGQVNEVLVEEGSVVKAGDVVARLGNREQLEASIANANTEVLAAQQALDKLYDDIDVAKIDAVRAIAAANHLVRDTQYQLDNFTVPTDQKKFSALEAVVEMEKRLDLARVAFEPYKYYPSEDDTRKDMKEKLDNAQGSYNAAVKRLEYETSLEEANSRRDEALRHYQELQQGPDPDAVEAAEARLAASNANLEAAKAARENLDLVATINGTVVEQNLIAGQQVIAGQPVMTVADFSQMFAETDDLTEIEVVDISLGQKTVVEPDAIPGLELPGTVDSISDIFVEKRGDVTYTARILLEEVDPRLRWGMTVLITFKK